MRTASDYRAQAAEAERTARQISRADHRDELMELARTWRELAERLDGPWPGEAANDDASAARARGA